VFENSGRHPWASINYIASHDGFTLHDLASYAERHNDANGEDNRDGHHNNLSLNHGVEGETDDLSILAERARYKRNLLATLFLSLGTPMLLMGDELSRSQRGNNNAYCQDNETSWLDWTAGVAADPDLLSFIETLADIRRNHPALRRFAYFDGIPDAETGLRDTYWLAPEGREMTMEDWAADGRRTIGFQFGNDGGPDARLLLIFNGAEEEILFRLPGNFPGRLWRPVFDSSRRDGRPDPRTESVGVGRPIHVAARSVQLLKHRRRAGR
jgi:glycogen operon protein